MSIYLDTVRYTSRGGAMCVYKSSDQPEIAQSRRKEIKELSFDSRARLAFTASNAKCGWVSMITLTYGEYYPKRGVFCKKDLNKFLTQLRKTFEGIRYLWFLEFQARGAPHVHILTDNAPANERRLEFARLWAFYALNYAPDNVIDTQLEKLLAFNTYVDEGGLKFWQDAHSHGGLSRYAVKYACKTEQKKVPPEYRDVGRFWGCSRGLVEFVGDEVIAGQDYTATLREILERKHLKACPKYVFGD